MDVGVRDHACVRDAPPRAAARARLAGRGRARHAHAHHLSALQRDLPTCQYISSNNPVSWRGMHVVNDQ